MLHIITKTVWDFVRIDKSYLKIYFTNKIKYEIMLNEPISEIRIH